MANLAFGVTNGDEDVACGNLKINRNNIAIYDTALRDSSGKKGMLVSGVVHRDEMGYTGIKLFAIQMAPSFTYTAYVADKPCNSKLGRPEQIVGDLALQFTTDRNGIARNKEVWMKSIAAPVTQALVIADCLAADGTSPDSSGECKGGQPRIMCYNLEIVDLQGMHGKDEAPSTGNEAPSTGSLETDNTQLSGGTHAVDTQRTGSLDAVDTDIQSAGQQVDTQSAGRQTGSCDMWESVYTDYGGLHKGKVGHTDGLRASRSSTQTEHHHTGHSHETHSSDREARSGFADFQVTQVEGALRSVSSQRMPIAVLVLGGNAATLVESGRGGGVIVLGDARLLG